MVSSVQGSPQEEPDGTTHHLIRGGMNASGPSQAKPTALVREICADMVNLLCRMLLRGASIQMTPTSCLIPMSSKGIIRMLWWRNGNEGQSLWMAGTHDFHMNSKLPLGKCAQIWKTLPQVKRTAGLPQLACVLKLLLQRHTHLEVSVVCRLMFAPTASQSYMPDCK